MLAAVHAKTVPRYVARVGLHKSFENYGTFGNASKMFLFATEPCDLVGCQPLEAMVKVGWDKGSILHSAGEDIAVCILDTASFCQSDTSKVADSCQENESEDVTQALGVGEVCWSDVIPILKSSGLYEKYLGILHRNYPQKVNEVPSEEDIIQTLETLAETPIRETPKVHFDSFFIAVLREVLSYICSINELYSG